MKQPDLARACGWYNDSGDPAQSRVSNYETGSRLPKIIDILEIAQATGVTVEWLVSPRSESTDESSESIDKWSGVIKSLADGQESGVSIDSLKQLGNKRAEKLIAEMLAELPEAARFRVARLALDPDLESR
ncbi:MAG: helix-turn-helix transcriptional regulator [Pseudomonadota bacterium]